MGKIVEQRHNLYRYQSLVHKGDKTEVVYMGRIRILYLPWRWRQYILPKRWYLSKRPHGIITQKTNISFFILSMLSSSAFSYFFFIILLSFQFVFARFLLTILGFVFPLFSSVLFFSFLFSSYFCFFMLLLQTVSSHDHLLFCLL